MMKTFTAAALAVLLAVPAYAQQPPNTFGNPGLDTTRAMRVNGEGGKITCSAGFDVTGYVTPTDLWALTGSATKTIRVNYVSLSGTATTSTSSDIALVKRSTANTGGTPTTITAVNHDALDAVCSATLVTYAAAPTTGTLIGDVRDAQLTMPPAASSTPALTYLVWDFGTRNDEAIVLRGTASVLALNFFGAALPAGMKISVTVQWTEE